MAVDEAVLPDNAAVVEVAPTDPLNCMVTGEPTGTLVACITTEIGSDNWLGSKRSTVLKLDPEYDGTG